MARALYIASVWLHIVAAMTWTGGIVMFVAAVRPWISRLEPDRRADFEHDFGRRLTIVTWSALAVLAATGIYSLHVRGVRVEDVLRPEWRSTSFGHLVVVKLTLVAMVVAATLAHQFLRARRAARWCGRLALLFGLAILAAAILMVRDAGPSMTGTASLGLGPSEPGAWFVSNGCTGCHTVSVYGHRNPAATGPDLSIAVEDVPRRFGRPLEAFLHAPVGTMQMVLTSRIQLTKSERDVAIGHLREAYRQYQLRRRAPTP